MAIDVVQEQMRDLSTKVDSLHGMVVQLTKQVSAIAVAQEKSVSRNGTKGALIGDSILEPNAVEVPTSAARASMDMAMSHKDILNDEDYLESDQTSATSALSPEIQIQRLTAQLTAAYNRMAVLEEQILACRFH